VLLSGKNSLSRDVGGLAYEIEEVDKAKSIKAPLLRSRAFSVRAEFLWASQKFLG
jgi:hypothetical protein